MFDVGMLLVRGSGTEFGDCFGEDVEFGIITENLCLAFFLSLSLILLKKYISSAFDREQHCQLTNIYERNGTKGYAGTSLSLSTVYERKQRGAVVFGNNRQ